MFIKPFDYHVPRTLSEALSIMTEKDGVTPIAGGTDLLVLMKIDRANPSQVLSLRYLDELHTMDTKTNVAEVGSAVTVSEIAESEICSFNSVMIDLVRQMATLQIRNRATIGGNLCTAAACADFPPALLVNNATVHLAHSTGARQMPLEKFFTGPRQTIKQSRELLTKITFQKNNIASAYVKIGMRKAGNIPIVGVACSMEIENNAIIDLRVAVTAASPVPILIEEARTIALSQKPNDELWQEVAKVTPTKLSPISDLRGSKEYRLHLAKVATRRALQIAYDRHLRNSNA